MQISYRMTLWLVITALVGFGARAAVFLGQIALGYRGGGHGSGLLLLALLYALPLLLTAFALVGVVQRKPPLLWFSAFLMVILAMECLLVLHPAAARPLWGGDTGQPESGDVLFTLLPIYVAAILLVVAATGGTKALRRTEKAWRHASSGPQRRGSRDSVIGGAPVLPQVLPHLSLADLTSGNPPHQRRQFVRVGFYPPTVQGEKRKRCDQTHALVPIDERMVLNEVEHVRSGHCPEVLRVAAT